MTNRRAARWVKGAAVSAVSAVLCYWIWSSLREWAQGVGDADPDAMFAGSLEALIAGIAGVASMPVLLWAGMRVLRERGNHLLVLLGALAWIFIGGHVVEDAVGTGATAGFLALFAVLGGLLAGVQPPSE
ncbi:hypothetical protein GCM10011579_052990 [Streptomyces albiflavescens]|uniref:Uncharacterized protein n=1 Tax=Streptomyces albiflavescens TaxID=1623582 RepID=A0A917Y9L7_9ACTN|nr:hypothetical protein [Streptomyces albiflavescens]GGN74170.1 hypothetical protein GCM10011579_052990 [Streptomyces albiflavescens]